MPLVQSDDAQIRFALAMNGGVSLAVWIGGVCDEVLRLCNAGASLAARRSAGTDPQPAPGWSVYELACWAAELRPRVDVLSGASAGGMNGVFLSLALLHGHADLHELRDLWLDAGSFSDLLREPLDADAPSLMRGDEYFLPKLQDAIRALATGPVRGADAVPIDLTLTVTSMDGRERSIDNDFGEPIHERHHAMTLRFRHRPDSSDFDDGGDPAERERIVRRLARACRSTASFPGAFEPSRVAVAAPGADRPPVTDAMLPRQASFSGESWMIDGGTLVNLPVDEALQAVFAQPATGAVRRVFAMVVPDPSAGSADAAPGAAGAAALAARPSLAKVVTSAISTIPRNQLVGGVLTDLERRNDQLDRVRVTRLELLRRPWAEVAAAAGAVFPAYGASRLRATRHVLLRHLERRLRAEAVGHVAAEAWRRGVLAITDEAGDPTTRPPWIPRSLAATGSVELSLWGRTTVRRSAGRLLHLVRHAAEQGTLDPVAERELRGIVTRVIARLGTPAQPDDPASNLFVDVAAMAPPDGVAPDVHVRDQLAALRQRWAAARAGTGAEMTMLMELADEVGPLTGLPALTGTAAEPTAGRALLALEVLENTFGGYDAQVEQTVETIRMDSICTSPIDPIARDRAAGKVAGVQLGHFGSFLKASWRANDWLWGRLDGAGDLIRIMLHRADEGRLAGLAVALGLDAEAGAPDGAGGDDLRDAVERAMLRRLHAEIVLEETPALVAALEQDRRAGGVTTRAARALEREWERARSAPPTSPQEQVALGSRLLGMNRIGAETLADEAGSDLLTHTSITALATGSTVIGSASPRLLRTPVRIVRYVALTAWAMGRATAGGAYGRALAALAFGIGAGLVAVELMPGVDLGPVLPVALLLFVGGALVSFARVPFLLAPLLALIAAPLVLRALPADRVGWWPDGWPYPTLQGRLPWVPTLAVIAAVLVIGSVRRPLWVRSLARDDAEVTARLGLLAGRLRRASRSPIALPAPAAWWRHALVWSALIAVPAAKSWQVVASDPWIGDAARQVAIVATLAVLSLLVLRDAAVPGLAHWRRWLLAVGLLTDRGAPAPARPVDGLTIDRWIAAAVAVVTAVVAASTAVDGWPRWVLVGVAAAALVPVVVLELMRRRPSRYVPDGAALKRPSMVWFVVPIVPAALGAAVALAVRGEVGHLEPDRLAEMAAVTAFGEELIFRGLLLAMCYRVMRPFAAHVLTALSFGAWHIGDAWNDAAGEGAAARVVVVVAVVAVTTVAGIVLAYLRRRSRSLLAPTLAHLGVSLPFVALDA